MDHMKKYWSHEIDCIRKGINKQDGYSTTISPHYINDRYHNPDYADRVFNELDILWAITNGQIVEGYDSGDNGRNGAKKGRNPEPERIIVGPAVSGDYCVVVVLMKSGNRFIVKTVFPADRGRYTKHIPVGKVVDRSNNKVSAKCDCCGKLYDSRELETVLFPKREFDGAACPSCIAYLQNDDVDRPDQ